MGQVLISKTDTSTVMFAFANYASNANWRELDLSRQEMAEAGKEYCFCRQSK